VARLVTVDDPEALDVTAAALVDGRTVVIPTETVYGVAALPSVTDATDQLFELKARPERLALAVLVDDARQAAELGSFSPVATRLAEEFWPGPLTLVLPRRPEAFPLALGGAPDTVGVRCPDDPFVRALARRVGPVATTSANRHGRPTPSTAEAAAAALVGEVAVVVDGGPRQGVPSTVVDCTAPDLRILRAGAIDERALAIGGAGPGNG
jgi:tRNA threonylcarbamoyl adenosine modification protein (Sua5/YciO/YrdC/YwlC family)